MQKESEVMAEISEACIVEEDGRKIGYKCKNCGSPTQTPTPSGGWSYKQNKDGELYLYCPKCNK